MIRIVSFCIGAVIASSAFAAEEPWRAITRACDENAETTFCVGKAGCPNWQWLARCTAENYDRPSRELQARLSWCIQVINGNRARSHTPALVGDPVADAMRCLAARH